MALANYFVDGFSIDTTEIVAMSLEVWSLIGSNQMTVSVADDAGVRTDFEGIARGAFIGLIATGSSEAIARIELFDGGHGAEGVARFTTYVIPGPGTAACFGLLFEVRPRLVR